jgi:hypothetical protein
LNLQQTSLPSDRPQGLITHNFSGLTRFPGEIVDRFVLHLLQAKSFIEVSSAAVGTASEEMFRIEIAHVELFQSHRWQAFSAVWNYRHFKMVW